MTQPIDFILKKLNGIEKTGRGFMALCPAHNDKNPSLSVSEGRDCRVLLHCHAGCNYRDILRALDLKPSEMFVHDEPEIEDIYSYRDVDGKKIFEIVRLNPKGFYARHKTKDGYVNTVKGIRLEPYRLPQLKKAVENNKTVFILEGEKDCDNFVANFKSIATTFPFGANRWQAHYADYFQDANVIIVPDNDKTGLESAQTVAKHLMDVARRIRILELPGLPHKGDVSDWIKQGGTLQQLKKLTKSLDDWEPPVVSDCTDIEMGINDLINELNKRYATVLLKGKYMVIEPDVCDPSLQCSTIDFINTVALEKKYSHRKIIVGYKADKPIERNVISVWLEHPDRRDYDGIVFDPGIDHGPRYYGLWQGFSITPKRSNIDLYLNHIFEVIADGNIEVYDHIIALFADTVQLRPRPGVALAILGEQGVGKGIAINNFGKLFGRHFLHITQGSQIIGKFNRHLAEGVVVFVDEAIWAGDKAAEGVLKGMITEDRLMIEPKGCDAYPVKNHTRLFLASNNDWIIPAGMEERRFFVVKASSKHIQDRVYFSRLQKQMDKGGLQGLLDYLQQYNLDGIDLTAFPRTAELANQKVFSMDPVQRFWYSILQEGELFCYGGEYGDAIRKRDWNDGVIATKLLLAAFYDYIKKQPQKWFSGDEGFGIALLKLVPNREKKRIKGEMSYIFQPLQECRIMFEKQTKQKWEWSEIDDTD